MKSQLVRGDLRACRKFWRIRGDPETVDLSLSIQTDPLPMRSSCCGKTAFVVASRACPKKPAERPAGRGSRVQKREVAKWHPRRKTPIRQEKNPRKGKMKAR